MAAAIYDILGVKPSRFRVASGTALVDVPMSYLNTFEIDANIETLTFEGEGTSHDLNVSSKISGTLTFAQFNTDWLTKVAGVTEVTAGLPAGVGRMWHPELGTYPYIQAEIDIRAKDFGAAGAEETLRVYIWKMLLQNPLLLSGIGNLEAVTQQFQWSSLATATDILGAAIPGVATATQTVHASMAELT